jgi:DNA-binding SARP family transcriptional activator
MTRFRICLLGKFAVWRDGEEVVGIQARKGQEFLAHLLLYRNRTFAREALAGTLWPLQSADQSRKSLRQALWQLQSALGTGDDAAVKSLLRVEPEWLGLNLNVDLHLDVAILEEAFLSVQGVPGDVLDREQVTMLEQAVQLYAGHLLPGCTLDWCLYERERLERFYLSLADKLMTYYEAQGDFETALGYGERILRECHCSERTHRRLMGLHYLLGDRSAALRQYRVCVAALEEELGARPGRQTEALYQQVLADRMEGVPPTLPLPAEATVSGAGPLSDTLSRLRDCLATLADLRHQLQHHIQSADILAESRN